MVPLLLTAQSSIVFEQKLEIPSDRRGDFSDHAVLLPNSIPGRQKLVDIDFTTAPDLIQ
ncbi:MAG: hypothetical protein AAFO95_22400 [Cyanobacteria bacterium J06600_6]